MGHTKWFGAGRLVYFGGSEAGLGYREWGHAKRFGAGRLLYFGGSESVLGCERVWSVGLIVGQGRNCV